MLTALQGRQDLEGLNNKDHKDDSSKKKGGPPGDGLETTENYVADPKLHIFSGHDTVIAPVRVCVCVYLLC